MINCFEVLGYEKKLYIKELTFWNKTQLDNLSCNLKKNIKNYEVIISLMKESTELLVFSLPVLNEFCKLKNSHIWIRR